MAVGSSSKATEVNRAAFQAERDAAKRIQSAQERVKEADREANLRIQAIQDEFIRQSDAERARSEDLILTEKDKAQEALVGTLGEHRKALKFAKRENEDELQKVQNFYRRAIRNSEVDGSDELREIAKKQHAQRQYEIKTNSFELASQKQQTEKEMEQLRNLQTNQRNELQQQNFEQVEKVKENQKATLENLQKNYTQKTGAVILERQDAIRRVAKDAAKALNELTGSYTQNLGAYSRRQSDPFYQLVDVGAHISEGSDAFTVSATIPEHEQDQVSIIVRDNEVVVSGRRQNSETHRSEDGSVHSSHAYQAYHQSIPIDFPVDGSKMIKLFDGDQMTVILPKKGDRFRNPAYESPKRVKSEPFERPDFPENLPKVEKIKSNEHSAEIDTDL